MPLNQVARAIAGEQVGVSQLVPCIPQAIILDAIDGGYTALSTILTGLTNDGQTLAPTEMTNVLLHCRCPIEVREMGLTYAAACGDIPLLTQLLKHQDLHPQANDNRLLKRAIEDGRVGVVAALLQDRRAHLSTDVMPAFDVAAGKGFEEMVMLGLSSRKATTRRVSAMYIQAAYFGRINVLKMLMRDHRFDSISRKTQFHAFTVSASGGFVDVVRLLAMKSGVSFDEALQHILCGALIGDQKRMVRESLTSPLTTFKGSLWDPLSYAVEKCSPPVIKLLLADGRFYRGSYSAEHLVIKALQRGELEPIELLLSDSKIAPQVRSSYPLEMSIHQARIAVVERLLTLPHTNRIAPAEKRRLARNAVYKGDLQIVQALDRCNFFDRVRRASIRFARELGHHDIVRYLRIRRQKAASLPSAKRQKVDSHLTPYSPKPSDVDHRRGSDAILIQGVDHTTRSEVDRENTTDRACDRGSEK